MGSSGRGGPRTTLVLVLLLVCCTTSVSSSEHHDSGDRGQTSHRVRHDAVRDTTRGVRANRGAASVPGPGRRRDVGSALASPGGLGAPSDGASDDIDTTKLKRKAKEIQDAGYDDETEWALALGEDRSGEGDGTEDFGTEAELFSDDPGRTDKFDTDTFDDTTASDATGSMDTLLELDAAAKATAKAFDETFPELVRYQHEDSFAAADSSSKFHEHELKGSGVAFTDGEDGYDDVLFADYEPVHPNTESDSAEIVSREESVTSTKPGKKRAARKKETRDAKSDEGDHPSDYSASLIASLTARAPPGPVQDLATSGFPVVVPGATENVPKIDTRLNGWQLSWNDEFDGSSLDETKWQARANQSAPGLERFGGQQQWYDPGECKVGGGALGLRTRRRPGGDFFLVPGAERTKAEEYPFVSCWVDTRRRFSQTYGRVEIRAKFPQHNCPGVQPTLWMLPVPELSVPKDACWPVGGEIDIATAWGKGRGGPGKRAGTVESGYHFAPKGECGADGHSLATFPSEQRGFPAGTKFDFHREFHVFAVEWDKESLKYFVDDEMTSEITRFHVPIIPRWPFFLILNTAVSPFGLPDALDCDTDLYHYVDYVRVYKRVSKSVGGGVYVFLVASVGGLGVLLLLAGCCVLRRGVGEDDDSEDLFGADEGTMKGGHVVDEDGVDRGFKGSTLRGSSSTLTKRRPVGPRLENLRLFDKPSASKRPVQKRTTFDDRLDYNLDANQYAGLRESLLPRGGDTSERAPLIGGVALRLPGEIGGRV